MNGFIFTEAHMQLIKTVTKNILLLAIDSQNLDYKEA
jgi:hypothetical protein